MKHTIILFVKNKKKANTKGKGKKKNDGDDRRPGIGRLHVGYCMRDWSMVFYEPTDDADPADSRQTPAAYKFETKDKKKSARRQPGEGEIAWLPHFDPKHIQTTKPRERDDIHKKTLYDAWRFLNEDDPKEVTFLEGQLDDINHRRWQSWFEEAKKFKDSEIVRRPNRRARRESDCAKIGMSKDQIARIVDLSDTTDSAYETDDDEEDFPIRASPMPPPPRPSPLKRGMANGRGGPKNDPKKRKTQSPLNKCSPLNSSSSGQGRRARGRLSGMNRGPPIEQDSSDDENEYLMSGGGSNLPNGSFLNRAARNTSTSIINGRDPRDDDRMSDDWDPSAPDGAPEVPQMRNENNWRVNVEEYQGGEYDEDAAMQRAMRESVAPRTPPPTRPTWNDMDGVTEQERAEIEEAMRDSMNSEGQRPPAPTAESASDEDDEIGHNRG